MTHRKKYIRRIGYSLIGVISIFFALAGVGRYREKHDEAVMRDRYQKYEEKVRRQIESIGNGAPLEEFKKMFPHAFYDKESGKCHISIPTYYSDCPTAINEGYETKYFAITDGMVIPDESGPSVGMSHGDRFISSEFGYIIYYFKRAWRSHIDRDWPPK